MSSIQLLVAWKGRGYDQQIYYSTFNGQKWTAPPKQVPGAFTSTQPSLSKAGGYFIIMAWKGMGDDERIFYSKFDGQDWDSPPKQVPGAFTSNQPILSDYSTDANIMAWKAGEKGTKNPGEDQRIFFSEFRPIDEWTLPRLLGKGMIKWSWLATPWTSTQPSLCEGNATLMAWTGHYGVTRVYYTTIYADFNSTYTDYELNTTPIWQAGGLDDANTASPPSLSNALSDKFLPNPVMVWKGCELQYDKQIFFRTFEWNVDVNAYITNGPVKGVPDAKSSNQPIFHRGMMIWKGVPLDRKIYYTIFDGQKNWTPKQEILGAFTSDEPEDTPYSRPSLRYVGPEPVWSGL